MPFTDQCPGVRVPAPPPPDPGIQVPTCSFLRSKSPHPQALLPQTQETTNQPFSLDSEVWVPVRQSAAPQR